MTCSYIYDGRTKEENEKIQKAYNIGRENGITGEDQNQIDEYKENMYEVLGKVSDVEIYAAEEGFVHGMHNVKSKKL